MTEPIFGSTKRRSRTLAVLTYGGGWERICANWIVPKSRLPPQNTDEADSKIANAAPKRPLASGWIYAPHRVRISDPDLLLALCDYLSEQGLIAVAATHGGRARSDGAVGPGCGARTNVAQPPLLDDERHRCGYRTSAPRSVSAVRVRRKGDLAVPAVTQRRCLAEGTGARLRFSRSFFFLLRSFRQRLTDLEPRPIDSDPSRLELQHGPRPRRGRPVRNRRSGSSLRPSLSPRPGIALNSEFACCPGRRAHWPGRIAAREIG